MQLHGAQIRVATGEADALLVAECQAAGAYAVVSQDSDFCVLEQVFCVYLKRSRIETFWCPIDKTTIECLDMNADFEMHFWCLYA